MLSLLSLPSLLLYFFHYHHLKPRKLYFQLLFQMYSYFSTSANNSTLINIKITFKCKIFKIGTLSVFDYANSKILYQFAAAMNLYQMIKNQLHSFTRSCNIPSSLVLWARLEVVDHTHLKKSKQFVGLMTAWKNWIKFLLPWMCTYMQKNQFHTEFLEYFETLWS